MSLEDEMYSMENTVNNIVISLNGNDGNYTDHGNHFVTIEMTEILNHYVAHL